MAKDLVTLARLKSLLRYDPDTGDFVWLKKLCRSRDTIGKVAGYTGNRYVQIRIDNKVYLAHRLAYFYMTGEWPTDQIDHKNLDKHDNSWVNLRPANRSQNSANKPALSTNSSGVKGVRSNPLSKSKPWRADIWFDNKSMCLGTFRTIEEAGAAYIGAAKVLRGEFARF